MSSAMPSGCLTISATTRTSCPTAGRGTGCRRAAPDSWRCTPTSFRGCRLKRRPRRPSISSRGPSIPQGRRASRCASRSRMPRVFSSCPCSSLHGSRTAPQVFLKSSPAAGCRGQEPSPHSISTGLFHRPQVRVFPIPSPTKCGSRQSISMGTEPGRLSPSGRFPRTRSPRSKDTRTGSTPWPSPPMGGPWPPRRGTTPSSCGTWGRGRPPLPWSSTTRGTSWRFHPTAGRWPRGPVLRSNCGTWIRERSPPP